MNDRIELLKAGVEEPLIPRGGRTLFVDPRFKTKYVKRYRMMLYLHMLYDIPQDLDITKPYYIEYTIFNQKQRYKVDVGAVFAMNGEVMIPLNRLRIFYFFSPDRKGVNEFINEQRVPCLIIEAYC